MTGSLRFASVTLTALVVCGLASVRVGPSVWAQSLATPERSATVERSATTDAPSSPSIDGLRPAGVPEAGLARAQRLDRLELPNTSGQYWVEYDIRPYTQTLKNVDRPQQAIIDWILRETGNEVWFQEPVGILTADRSTLRVYHTAGMHQVVAKIYERFVNGSQEPQVFSLRMISIGNPTWRGKALPLMRSTEVKTPGLQAWVMSKENSAIFGAQLRQRTDARELQAVDLVMVQGQTQTVEQLRSRSYLKEYTPNTTAPWPPFTPKHVEIQEGYRMGFSPLLSLDGRVLDVMLKCDIDQVERFIPVPIDTPTPGLNMQVEIPQLVSWRLQERFRWPADQVLVLSCGVIAAPTGTVQNTLLGGGGPNLLGMNRLIPSSMAGQRNDALLLIEYKGSGSHQLSPTGANTKTATTTTGNFPGSGSPGVSRGRY
ncbi:MAG: hypothetical protein ACK553_16785 [Planctomycetota bacterium]|jgi:hypothetical protein